MPCRVVTDRIFQRIEVVLIARPNSLIRPFMNRLSLKVKVLQAVTMYTSISRKLLGEQNFQKHR